MVGVGTGPALVEGNRGDGSGRAKIVTQNVRESASLGVVNGGGVGVKRVGRSVARGVVIVIGCSSGTGGEGADQGWDCNSERNGWTGITS